MSNNFDSNFTRQLAKVILKSFDTNRVLSKNVDTSYSTVATQVRYRRVRGFQAPHRLPFCTHCDG